MLWLGLRFDADPCLGQTEGTRPRGRPRKWIDNTREDCSEMGLTLIDADRLARDRSRRRFAVQKLGCQPARVDYVFVVVHLLRLVVQQLEVSGVWWPGRRESLSSRTESVGVGCGCSCARDSATRRVSSSGQSSFSAAEKHDLTVPASG